MPMFDWLRHKPSPPTEDKSRVLTALDGYPPYDPPRWAFETKPAQEADAEYKAYFLENRNRRVEALSGFLAKFDVELSLDDDGLKAVSGWCPVYLDLLVDGLPQDGLHQGSTGDAIWRAYHWLETPWIDSLIGLNPILDLGVYMGECLLSKNRRLKWLPVLNPEVDKDVTQFYRVVQAQSMG
jgi:hypothetical protein